MAGFGSQPVAMTTHVRGRVAHYSVVRELGEGGMGVVLLARDEALGRNVALKLLSPRYADDVQFRARFTRESRLAAAIDHPNIIPIFEAGEAQGQLFIAMRYVDGPDLRRVLAAEGTLAPARALAIVEQVARALDAAHHAGLVHRDVKPGNVMIDPAEGREHCYLTDFGLTKNMSSSSGYTETGQWVGTLHYMAPEQIEDRKVDGRADQYALACVLFECLAGFPPFRRDSDVALMYAHLNEPPPALCAMRPELPAAVDTVLARALAKAAPDRYASCSAMVGEFRAAMAGASVPAFRPSVAVTRRRFARPAPVTELAPPAKPPAPQPAPPAYVSQPPAVHSTAKLAPSAAAQRSYLRAAVILAVAILLCAGGIGTALVLKSSNGSSGLSASARAHRELVNRTVLLHREIVTVSRKVQGAPRKVDAATKARLQRDLRQAQAIASQARQEQAAAVGGSQSLAAATMKLTGVVTELLKVADGQTQQIAKLHERLNELNQAIDNAASDPAMPKPVTDVPGVAPTVSGAGAAPAAAIKLPNDATTTVTAPAGKQIDSVTDVGDVNGDGQRDFGFVTSAAGGGEPDAYVVLKGSGGPLDLGSLGKDQGFQVKGASSLGPAGDVNGDTHDDLVATGPPSTDTGLPSSVFVIYGGGAGSSLGDVDLTSGGADLQIDLPAPDPAADAAPVVRSAGDVNHDGFDDLVIGDPAANSGSGGAWVVRGSDRSGASASLVLDTLAPADGYAITGDEGDGFGSSVTSADVNGDGFSDVVVGAPHAAGDVGDAGAAFVVYGSKSTPDAVDVGQLDGIGFAIHGSNAGSLTGTVVTSAGGDLNGDGNDDLLVTAPGSSPNGQSGAGSAFVVFGPAGNASPDIALGSLRDGFEIQGPEAGAGLGSLAAPAGDLNGDGRPDVVIGAGQGALAYVVYGKPDTGAVDLASPSGMALPISDAAAGGLQSLAGGADLDGDRKPDVVVGPSDPGGGSAAVYATPGVQR